jgi:GDP-4-dehydro-6-deoxy-D-mannose reductase
VTWLITGAGGFLGSHLAEALAADGIEVHGTVRTPPSRGTTNAGAAVAHHECDIRDAAQVSAVISAVHPTTICHLAAQSSPTESWIDATETFNTNAGGLVRVLDAVRSTVPDSLVLAVGSSAEYGPSSGPIAEDHPQVPGTPYGVSKVAQDLIAALYHAHYGMRTVRLRPFFVVGPRKMGDVTSDLAKRVVAVEDGTTDTVTVGNLDAIRDLLDVRDAVAAFRMIAAQAAAGSVYNVCSGVGHPVRAVLDGMIALSSVPIAVRDDPALLRPGDESIRVGDSGRLRALGWSPLVGFERMVGDVLDYWRREAEIARS